MLVSVVLGVFVGAVLGLTGAGGGILAVPALVVGLGWSMQQAAPVALIAVAGGAGVGAIEGFRRNLVRYRAAALMAVAGVPVTALGIRASHAVPQRVLLGLFAAVMLLVSFRLLTQARREPVDADSTSSLGSVDGQTGRFVWTTPTAMLLAGIGALTGFMTGLLGVGGGFVLVPLLRRFTGLSMHGVVSTSLLVVAIVGAGGVITALLQGAVLPLELTLLFAAATVAGMLGGRFASRRLSAAGVQLGFGIVLLVVAIGLLLKTAFQA